MEITIFLANLIGGIPCLVFGLIILTGKTNFLIAGLNTMSEQERAKYNESAISKFVGWMLIAASAVLLVACIPIYFGICPNIMIIASYGIFMVMVIGGVIYANVSPRFKR